ncbi:uncharacterized protein PADG_04776 [Paracoccidioides brasiliensis Pb18]|uniref:Uncharacterized protein n=1 Tax=Paracoccidioides brasiliensis (strain Pb18) TaxID=502780 RepID=C1GCQ4_PARBD|nr:uncharacterized protein PADG_04776 [Paracoccidioides brasiliensis Pb18]EEH48697.1 hypothetical protein PADG_04776 [Paracoccidioides brasiliensis Pb18]
MSQTTSPSIISSFLRWLRLKNYQYEVTVALYMLTPTEKFIFNTLLLLITSMLLTAAYVYLPNHVATISKRIWYYWAGDTFTDPPFANVTAAVTAAVASTTGKSVLSATQQKGYDGLMETAKNVARAATAAAGRAVGEL